MEPPFALVGEDLFVCCYFHNRGGRYAADQRELAAEAFRLCAGSIPLLLLHVGSKDYGDKQSRYDCGGYAGCCGYKST